MVAHKVMGSIRTFDKNGQSSHGYTQSLQHHYISRFTRKNLVDCCPMSRKISIFATKINSNYYARNKTKPHIKTVTERTCDYLSRANSPDAWRDG